MTPLSPLCGLESTLARHATSKLSVCPRLLSDFPRNTLPLHGISLCMRDAMKWVRVENK